MLDSNHVTYGARCVRSDGQSTPAKKGCALISSVEVWPSRPSRSQSRARTCRSGVWGVRRGAMCGRRAAFESKGALYEVLGLGRQCGFRRELEGLLVAQDLAARHQRIVAVERRVPVERSREVAREQGRVWWEVGRDGSLGTGLLPSSARLLRGVPHEHLKHDDAERPPVAVLVIPGLEQDLRRHVVGRSHR